ncbi:hypothetical protein [Acetivibrio saccincola]|jgi:ribosomal protein L29|uniref:Uncharacterized protein n=1 Tax=Acetivibrio saccincola TaxID=1677857 RepID=A0A2K9ELQ5_9FIRM|nr:hypothetical protein [Acetivibrio saccincola]AUG56370.1 hypothetical protein HVS_02065 [Acetivibrio saccincola]
MSRRKLEISEKINTYEELEALYRDCKDAKFRMRMLAVLQTWDGKPSFETAV